MEKHRWRRLRRWRPLLVLLGLILALVLWVSLSGGDSGFQDKYAGSDLSASGQEISRHNSYARYLSAHEGARPGKAPVLPDLSTARLSQGASQHSEGIFSPEGSVLHLDVVVEEAGLYRIELAYTTLPGRGLDVKRSLTINGEMPFFGADSFSLPRMWTDAGPSRYDNQGNQIRPQQIERFGQVRSFLKDPQGYEVLPYAFYFPAGRSELALIAVNEPFILNSLSLLPPVELVDYATYHKGIAGLPSQEQAAQVLLSLPGEAASLRSSPSLYARYDRSSPQTQPQDLHRIVLNYIGGDPWRSPGQWIAWQVQVPADGFYHIAIKGRQRYQRGSISSRALYINGQLPFAQMQEIPFSFDNSWQTKILGEDGGEPYRFYLTAGSHELRLEATLGGMGQVLSDLDESVFRLNQIYRRILVLTGVNPDPFRDYNIHQVYPSVIDDMDLESKRLYAIVDQAVALTGQKSDKIAAAQTLATQLETFVKDPYRITSSFVNFKDNITALGTAMQAMAEVKLDIDTIYLFGEQASLEEQSPGLLSGLGHEIGATFASYTVDYDALGDVYTGDEALQVWIMTGRDQSMVLKTMVDDTFTPESGIPVNIKLVDPTALLGAVVAGNGPDLVVSTDSWNPVNYALRSSAEDLSQFADFDQVRARFWPAAFDALSWQEGVYALPETQVISALFYRKDILAEFGLQVPETWEDLIGLLPTIQGNNMSVGVPYPTVTAPNQFALYAMVYQNGGSIYNDQATATLLGQEPAVQAFDFYTSLYTDYGLPKEFDFLSRFRSGEMPLGVSDFTTYNVLAVSAPEIRGLWDFTLIPGSKKADGSISHAVHSQGASTMMIKTADDALRDRAWTFMKWWTSAPAQLRFGREIEAVLGPSARYPTANIEALTALPWSAGQLQVLSRAMEEAVGFREIAGGYYTTRGITNAVRKVINEYVDPRETMIEYARQIDIEITKKRLEFGLDAREGGAQ